MSTHRPIRPRLSAAALVLIVLSALAALPIPCRAENPAVSLKVENATCAEVMAQLSKASGIALQLYTANIRPEDRGPGDPGLNAKASFDWSHVTFAQALRQLCVRYNLRPARQTGGSYTLWPAGNPGAPPPAEKPVGLFEKNGARLSATGVMVMENRTLSFLPNGPVWDNSRASVSLHCRLLSGDAETVAGVENASAKDDRGNLLVAESGLSYVSGGAEYPDEWSGSVSLTTPSPGAKKLQWLEGDLMVYKTVRHHRVEIPLPLAGKSARKELPGLIVGVSHYRTNPAAGDADDDDFPDPFGPTPMPQQGFSVRVKMFAEAGGPFAQPGQGWSMTPPSAAGASGKVYTSSRSQMQSNRGGQQGWMTESEYEFAMDEPPAKLVFDFVEKSNPEKLLTFRMADIPLPPAVVAPIRRLVKPPPAPSAPNPPPDRPYYERGGGTVLNQIRIQQKPAAEGTLSIGLAARETGGWSGIRWQSVDIGKDGTAKLEDLKPGTYRLLRVYRPATGMAQPRGRWENNEVTITVTAGKEAAPPPLRWVPEPAPARRVTR